eukprot:scaffold32668_cov36-Phaeocystis_antarctica.AAC.2
MGLMIAGHETSSNTSAWALHLLATHPEVRTINPNPSPNPDPNPNQLRVDVCTGRPDRVCLTMYANNSVSEANPTPNPTPTANQVQQQVRQEVAHLELGSATLDQLYACPLLQGVMYE